MAEIFVKGPSAPFKHSHILLFFFWPFMRAQKSIPQVIEKGGRVQFVAQQQITSDIGKSRVNSYKFCYSITAIE